MIGVTLLAAACGYLAHEAKIARDRKAMVNRILFVEGGWTAHNNEPIWSPPWIRRLLGDKSIDEVNLPVDSPLTAQEINAVLPEAHVQRSLAHVDWLPRDAKNSVQKVD
jgi:hypothetical protein